MSPNEHLNRRSFLMMAGTAAAIGLGDTSRPILQAQAREASIDHTIRIAPSPSNWTREKLSKRPASPFLGQFCDCERASRSLLMSSMTQAIPTSFTGTGSFCRRSRTERWRKDRRSSHPDYRCFIPLAPISRNRGLECFHQERAPD